MRFTCFAAVMVVGGCASEAARVSPTPPAFERIEPKDRLEAVAVGAPNPILLSETQRKATAREAAMMRARHELASTLRALILQSGITLEHAVHLDPRLGERIDLEVAAAQATAEFTPDDGCVVRLLLSKRRLAEDLGVRFR